MQGANYYLYVPKSSKIYTIVLNYKPCYGICIVIKLQFAIQNLVYVKSIF